MKSKKPIILLLLMSLLFAANSVSFASINPSEDMALGKANEIMRSVINSGTYEEFSSNDTFYLSSRIPLYQVQNEKITDSKSSYYFVVNEQCVIKGMITIMENAQNDYSCEFTTAFNEVINKLYAPSTGTAFITDESSIWMFDGQEYIKIFTNPYENSGIDSLSGFEVSQLSTFKISAKTKLNNIATRDASVSAFLSVPVKTQGTGTSYCWACCAVSAGQYKVPSKIYTPESIAKEYSGNLYTPKSIVTIKDILLAKYGRTASIYLKELNFSAAQTYLPKDKPIVAHISYSGGGGHFVVVNGYHIPGSGTAYLYIMNPLSGNRVLSIEDNGTGSKELLYWNPGKTTKYNYDLYLVAS